MLTPNDIRNPDRQSGYAHVSYSRPDRPSVASHGGGKRRFQAQSGTPGTPRFLRGPMRLTADEAAQDYCDYMNAGTKTGRLDCSKPNLSSVPKVYVDLNHAGHKGSPGARRTPRKPRRGRKALTLGYVYCIAEEGSRSAVKIGYAKTPTLRIGTLQTGNPRLLVILGVIRGTLADEREIHAEFQNDNILGEWFRPSPELLSVFSIDPELMA